MLDRVKIDENCENKFINSCIQILQQCDLFPSLIQLVSFNQSGPACLKMRSLSEIRSLDPAIKPTPIKVERPKSNAQITKSIITANAR